MKKTVNYKLEENYNYNVSLQLLKNENLESLLEEIGSWGYDCELLEAYYIRVYCLGATDFRILLEMLSDTGYNPIAVDEMIKPLIEIKVDEKEMTKLYFEDETFINDFIEDLENMTKFEFRVLNEKIGIKMNFDNWNLQFDIIKTLVKNFNESTYRCDCSSYEYLEELRTCSCDKLICRDCYFETPESYFCLDCAERINNEEF